MSHCQDVKSNFFQEFYHNRIGKVFHASSEQSSLFDLAVLKFWCSVIDFYGGIYFVGKTNSVQIRAGRVVLTTGSSFALFVEDFFPPPEKNYGKFIYDIFRSGVVHQLSPKRSHVHWQSPRSELVWIELDSTKTNPNDNKTAHINLSLFQALSYQAYCQFYDKVDQNGDPSLCDNIYNHLINVSDIFEDGKALNIAYNNLKNRGHEIKRP